MHFVPYLNFNGNCREAFEFYEKTLGGRIESLMTFGESPMASQTPADQHHLVLHATIQVGNATLMASDAPPQHYEPASGIWVCIVNDDTDEAERIWKAVEPGGSVVMPFGPTFWAKRFGMVKDRFGTPWMINSGEAESAATQSVGGESHAARA